MTAHPDPYAPSGPRPGPADDELPETLHQVFMDLIDRAKLVQFLIWSERYGTFLMPDRAGYTLRIHLAGRYSHAEQLQIIADEPPIEGWPHVLVAFAAPEFISREQHLTCPCGKDLD